MAKKIDTTTDTVTFNGETYVKQGSQVVDTTPTVKQIVVADRGWVFVGDTTTDEEGNVTISNAKVIRVWGTTKGLGQLALEGSQKDTVLDDSGVVRVPSGSVIAVFNVADGVSL